ncbi:hypothetical protein JOC78_000322 [Bacillus ectoiniformans]|uniref:hypothetical protein n=1 Tax=Bacillus ectoiniformans TaxID=1494429 RepID=UPI00195D9B45|nr:hypothetical protein [Bacillus ectoiniformans]MBM7647401.1 hypothetical protein [Bacillus ectoiniformans]
MKGIVLFNKGIHAPSQNGTLTSINNWLFQAGIQPVKLNRFQFNAFYTIPHALLYDLQKSDLYLDCLVIDSFLSVETFIHIFPEKWVLLTSYFQKVIFLQDLDMTGQA